MLHRKWFDSALILLKVAMRAPGDATFIDISINSHLCVFFHRRWTSASLKLRSKKYFSWKSSIFTVHLHLMLIMNGSRSTVHRVYITSVQHWLVFHSVQVLLVMPDTSWLMTQTPSPRIGNISHQPNVYGYGPDISKYLPKLCYESKLVHNLLFVPRNVIIFRKTYK